MEIIKGVKNINEYKLRRWTAENFNDGSVEFQTSDSGDSAVIRDKQGEEMTIGIGLDGKVFVLN